MILRSIFVLTGNIWGRVRSADGYDIDDFVFTSSGVDPALRAAVASAIASLRSSHPGVAIEIRWR
jgi:hypothetical protein